MSGQQALLLAGGQLPLGFLPLGLDARPVRLGSLQALPGLLQAFLQAAALGQ